MIIASNWTPGSVLDASSPALHDSGLDFNISAPGVWQVQGTILVAMDSQNVKHEFGSDFLCPCRWVSRLLLRGDCTGTVKVLESGEMDGFA